MYLASGQRHGQGQSPLGCAFESLSGVGVRPPRGRRVDATFAPPSRRPRRARPRGFAANKSPQNVASASRAVFERDGGGSRLLQLRASTTRAVSDESAGRRPAPAALPFRLLLGTRACRRGPPRPPGARPGGVVDLLPPLHCFMGRRRCSGLLAAAARCVRAVLARLALAEQQGLGGDQPARWQSTQQRFIR